jgi:sodium transport system permease protein
MNSKKVMIVYRKELMEVLRDKRTLFTTLLLPVILYPLLIVGFNAIMARQTGVLEKKSASVAVQDSVMNPVSMAIIEKLAEVENYTILPAAGNAQSLYENKDIQAIVSISDSLTASGLTTYQVYIQYDTANEQSMTVYSRLKDKLAESKNDLLHEQLELRGVHTDVLEILDVRPIDTASSQRKMV